MNDTKVAFIVCVNDEQYYEMCKWYIEQLIIPEGYYFEIIPLRGEKNIANAYNKAMSQSDAKYKIYMHQDVFILNRNMISDVINVFWSDDKIGLVGLIGGSELPSDACCWDRWNSGKVYACDSSAIVTVSGCFPAEECVIDVDAIDGMIMISQYDLLWREDVCDGWDFYDISQSLEYKRRGYRVVVPYQKEPWTLHDCGFSKLGNYEKTRKRILEEYSEMFDNKFEEKFYYEMDSMGKRIFDIENELITKKDYSTLIQIDQLIHDENGDLKFRNNDVALVHLFLKIMENETNDRCIEFTFMKRLNFFSEMKEKYKLIKFNLMKIDFNSDPTATDIIKKMISEKQVSTSAINIICAGNCKKANTIMHYLGI